MKVLSCVLTLLSAAGLTQVSCQTISEIVAGDPNFSTLLEALTVTGLDQALAGEGPFTVFAPTNNAFESLKSYSPGTLEYMLKQSPPDELTELLQYHVISGAVTFDDITNGVVTNAVTLQGENITLSATEPSVDGFASIQSSIQADNGVIHIINMALAPESISLPPGIAIEANNTGQFFTLLSLVQAAGLENQLNTPGPFTVFAPTDEAFAKIPNLEEIVSNQQTAFAILANHVVGGVYTADLLQDGMVLKSLIQQDLTVAITGDSITINGATVVFPDVLGSNGVVHGIDTVLIPDLSGLDGNSTSTIEPSSAPETAPPANFPTSMDGADRNSTSTIEPSSAPETAPPANFPTSMDGADGNSTSTIEPSSAPETAPPANFPTSMDGADSGANLCSFSGIVALIFPTLAALYMVFV